MGNEPNIELFAKYIWSQPNIELFGFNLELYLVWKFSTLKFETTTL